MVLDPKKEKELLSTIHRHWIWANRIRIQYFAGLGQGVPSEDAILDWFVGGDGMYMCLWYGLLYCVCEALRENGFTVPSAQADIDAIYDSLRLFRNAVFHVQEEYWSPKLFNIMGDPKSATKIIAAHQGIGAWFLKKNGSVQT